MTQIDKELARAIKNLNSVSKSAVPKASAQAINRVSARVVTHSIRETSKKIAVKQAVIRQRVKRVRARASSPVSYIRIRRGNIPAISIGAARTQIKQKRGEFLTSRAQRNGRGRFTKREYAGFTSIRVGKHVFENAFLQKMSNGRWQIMQRTSDARYPIKVVSIPLKMPITQAFQLLGARLLDSDLPKELRAALKQQLRLIIERS